MILHIGGINFMKRKKTLLRVLVIAIVMLFISGSCLSGLAFSIKTKKISHQSKPLPTRTIIYVDDDNTQGPWDGTQEHPYRYIQDGIDNAEKGDMVFVMNGSYTEDLYVNKAVELSGENKANVLLSSSSHSTIHVKVNNITIRGFSIINGNSAGIYMDGIDYCTITDNIIMGNQYGIQLFSLGDDYNQFHTITDNLLSGNNFNLMMMYSHHNQIHNNIIEQSTYGIFSIASSDNSYKDNELHDNIVSFKMQTGSNNSILTYNTITDSTIGINCIDSHGNSIIHNTVIENTYGISLEDSNGNFIVSNTLLNNSVNGIRLHNCGDSILYYNNLIGNNVQAFDDGINVWDNSYPDGGNYWDDYTGVDENGDGIGDTAYEISGGDNQDRYPLMNQTSGNLPPSTPQKPEGVAVAGSNITIDFSSFADDPESDDLYYLWDWGDGNFSSWLGPYNSSETMITNYSWYEIGVYDIRVKVKDINELESSWSESCNITIAPQIELSNLQRGFVYFNLFDFNNSYLFSYILETIGVTVVVGLTYELYLEASASEYVDRVEFEMINPVFGDNVSIVDDTAEDGFTGYIEQVDAILWQLSAKAYNEDGVLIDADVRDFFIFLKIGRNSGTKGLIGALQTLRNEVINTLTN